MFAAASTHPAFAQRLKLVVVAGFLALSLLVGATTAPRVGAEAVDRGLDGFSNACADLQDQARSLAGQYSSIGRANAGDPRLDDILSQLRSLGTTWQQIGCQGVYGNILGFAISPTNTSFANTVSGGLLEQLPPTTSGNGAVAPIGNRSASR